MKTTNKQVITIVLGLCCWAVVGLGYEIIRVTGL